MMEICSQNRNSEKIAMIICGAFFIFALGACIVYLHMDQEIKDLRKEFQVKIEQAQSVKVTCTN